MKLWKRVGEITTKVQSACILLFWGILLVMALNLSQHKLLMNLWIFSLFAIQVAAVLDMGTKHRIVEVAEGEINVLQEKVEKLALALAVRGRPEELTGVPLPTVVGDDKRSATPPTYVLNDDPFFIPRLND